MPRDWGRDDRPHHENELREGIELIMAFWKRSPLDPKQEVTARVRRLERQNIIAVNWDHRFGNIGVITIAIAALIGMAVDSVQRLLSGQISQGDAAQLGAAFFAVVVMNRALLAAARNMRRAEGRGEAPLLRDKVTMWGVMVIESVSFGFMLWIFEGKPDLLSVQGFLLSARAVVLPYATVYLEQQREQPPDPVDIGIQAEIGQGLGVMGDLVEQAYDRNVPTALKLDMYRANATLTPAMNSRLDRMTEAAAAYEHYKQTGQGQLLDRYGKPLHAQQSPPVTVVTPHAQGNGHALPPPVYEALAPAESHLYSVDPLTFPSYVTNGNGAKHHRNTSLEDK